jgi:hypothetical protein
MSKGVHTFRILPKDSNLLIFVINKYDTFLALFKVKNKMRILNLHLFQINKYDTLLAA